MNYLDYMQMTRGQQIAYKIKSFFTGIPGAIKNLISIIVFFFKTVFKFIGNGFKGYGQRFVKGDIGTKLSYLFMGMGNIFYLRHSRMRNPNRTLYLYTLQTLFS